MYKLVAYGSSYKEFTHRAYLKMLAGLQTDRLRCDAFNTFEWSDFLLDELLLDAMKDFEKPTKIQVK